MSISQFSRLPEELLQSILLKMNYDNIQKICLISNDFINVCRLDTFWRAKFIHDYGFNPPTIGLTQSLKEIYLNQNNILSFGNNDMGQLGLNNINKYESTKIQINNLDIKAKFVSCGGYHTVLIDMDNNIWSFGHNFYGQLGLGYDGDNTNRNIPTKINGIKAKYVSCGFRYTVLIDMDNNVWSFGENYSGQLGLGDINPRNEPTKINNIKAKSVSCGENHTVLIDMNNNVLSFGGNIIVGRLGLGDNVKNRNIPTKINDIKAKSVSCGVNHTVLITGISN